MYSYWCRHFNNGDIGRNADARASTRINRDRCFFCFWSGCRNTKENGYAFSYKVYQRNDLFDLMQVSSWTRKGETITGTNIERMAAGNAPIGYDGKSVQLHHLLQTQDGPIVEVSQTFHNSYYSTIHMNTGQLPSTISRSQFNSWTRKYWMNRALDFN